MLLFQLQHVKAGLLHINGKISSLFVQTALSSPVDIVSVLCPCRAAASWAAQRPMLPRQGLHPFCRAGAGLQEGCPMVLVRSCAHLLPQLCTSRDLCSPRAGWVQEAQQNRDRGRKQPGCKVLQPKPGLSCALQHLEELIKIYRHIGSQGAGS